MSYCARAHATPGEHTSLCRSETCRGCVPAEAKEGRLCTACATQARQALRAIPDLAAYAASRPEGRLTPGKENSDPTRHAVNAAPASPSPGYDLAEEAAQWAYRMAVLAADHQQQTGPFTYSDGIPVLDIARHVGYILDQFAWYASQDPAYLDIHAEARQWRTRLERSTGRDELVHRLKEACPACNHRTLMRNDGSDTVKCRHCHATWDEGGYGWLAHTAAS